MINAWGYGRVLLVNSFTLLPNFCELTFPKYISHNKVQVALPLECGTVLLTVSSLCIRGGLVQELCGSNPCCLFVSSISFHKFSNWPSILNILVSAPSLWFRFTSRSADWTRYLNLQSFYRTYYTALYTYMLHRGNWPKWCPRQSDWASAT